MDHAHIAHRDGRLFAAGWAAVVLGVLAPAQTAALQVPGLITVASLVAPILWIAWLWVVWEVRRAAVGTRGGTLTTLAFVCGAVLTLGLVTSTFILPALVRATGDASALDSRAVQLAFQVVNVFSIAQFPLLGVGALRARLVAAWVAGLGIAEGVFLMLVAFMPSAGLIDAMPPLGLTALVSLVTVLEAVAMIALGAGLIRSSNASVRWGA